jgi:hypothetical protein
MKRRDAVYGGGGIANERDTIKKVEKNHLLSFFTSTAKSQWCG